MCANGTGPGATDDDDACAGGAKSQQIKWYHGLTGWSPPAAGLQQGIPITGADDDDGACAGGAKGIAD
eukprot:5893862-Karenia_brevis.AAC.1